MSLVLAVDWTAAATTVSIVDTAAHTIVGEGRADHGDGDIEPSVWWDALVRASRLATDTLEVLGLPLDEVRSVLVGSNEPPGGLVALDAAGAPVHAGLTGAHTESEADAAWLVSHTDGGEDAWLDATGGVPTSGSTVALLSWLHRTDPDAWSTMHRVTLPIGYLTERMGVGAVLAPHTAAGTGVLDRRDGQLWRIDLLAIVDSELDWDAHLPRIVTADDPIGLLSDEVASELGLRAAMPVHVGELTQP